MEEKLALLKGFLGAVLVCAGVFAQLWSVFLAKAELISVSIESEEAAVSALFPLGFIALVGAFLILVGIMAVGSSSRRYTD